MFVKSVKLVDCNCVAVNFVNFAFKWVLRESQATESLGVGSFMRARFSNEGYVDVGEDGIL